MSNDTFTEITSRSWFGRIGDSIKGILFGIVFVLIGTVLLFWNEGRAVKTAKGLAEGAKNVVSVKADAIDPANNGKLIHFSAPTATSQRLSDPVFSVNPPELVLKLRRDVEMYQWKEKSETKKEKNLGGSETTKTTYTYSKQWSGALNDSSSFKVRSGHENPADMPFPSHTFVASPIKAGAFTLSDPLVAKITTSEPFPVSSSSAGAGSAEAAPGTPSAPVALPAGIKPLNGGYYKGSDPASPQIGDAKISFSIVKPGQVSVVAKQVDGQLTDYLTQTNTRILDLRPGNLSAPDMFNQLQSENAMLTWILRLVGYLVITIGLAAILKPLTVVADFIPLLGSLLGAGTFLISAIGGAALSVVVIGIGWFVYRPVLAICLFVGAGGLVFLIVRASRSRKAATAR